MDKDNLMEFKKSIVYFYTVQNKLQIPINRYVYNMHCNAIDLFEIKKQEIENHKYVDDYILYSFSIKRKRMRKLHLENFDSFRLIFIDGMYLYNSKKSTRLLSKVFYLKDYATKVDGFYDKFYFKKRTSFYQEGIYLYFNDGLFFKKPIEILYITTGNLFKFHTINFIYLDKGSCVKIIERHKILRICKEKSIIKSITKIYMNKYSYLDYCKIKGDRSITYSFDHTFILQKDRSECNINSLIFSGKSIMTFLFLYQLGNEIHSYINNFSIFEGKITHNSLIEHAFSDGKSKDIYKGIYDKVSNTIINGKIIVLKSAKNTNATQNSTSILLTDEATVNANPQLEIFSEYVKCYHGCVIGQLGPQDIFYLRSRGIGKPEAIRKLLFAFARDTLEFFFFQRLRTLISKLLNKNVIINRN